MLKRFLSVVLIVSLLSVPAFAASNDVYELEPDAVEAPTMLSLAAGTISPLAATSWDTSDQSNLSAIRNAFYSPNTGYVSNSLLGWVKKLADNYQPSPFDSDSVLELTQIKSAAVVNLPYLEVINRNINSYIANLDFLDQIYVELDRISYDTSILSTINDHVAASRSELVTIDDNVYQLIMPYSFNTGYLDDSGWHVNGSFTLPQGSWLLNYLALNLGYDVTLEATRDRTLFSRIKQMQEVLASDDDLALAKSQQANREQVEDSFLSGSSGDTSLGASDFGALSAIGGSFKDTVSLNGQSSISYLTDGLASADASGQGWFSTSTKDALDTVSSAASYSLRNDPYNMAGWEQRYAWLNGG